MKAAEEELLAVLRVGRDVSSRGRGTSLAEALERCRYKSLRPFFGSTDLLPIIRANSDLAEDWVRYSEDKRTSGGWYLREDSLEVGRLTAPQVSTRFPTLAEAVAEYVVRELDSFSQLS